MNINNTYRSENDEISLIELFNVIWSKKIFISTLTFLVSLLSIAYSLTLPNIYSSQAILAPSEAQDSLSSKMGSLSSLGGIAGISLPNGEATKSQEAMRRIKSHEFFANFFLPNIKIENLLAAEKWNANDSNIYYDSKIFDADSKKWVRKTSYSKRNPPSSQEAYLEYRKILSIIEDKKTSFVTISIKHPSPLIAKKWLDIIIYEINESMRTADQNQAKKSISYLSEVQQSNNIQSIKEATSLLLERQMQTLMLTSSNDYYVYKVIDSPVVSEQKSEPKRKLIVIASALFSLMLSIAIVFFQYLKEYSRLRK